MNKLFKFEPLLKPTLWGGESWEISDVSGHESVVSERADKWATLSGLINKYGAALVGAKAMETYGNVFPLLIKFIDARQDLSVQVHPDDELAWKRHNSRGKTEMWYVIDATPDATLLSGKTRELHTELAKDAIDYSILPDYRTLYSVEENKEVNLVECPFFKTSLVEMTVDQCIDLSETDSFVVLMVCDGDVKISVDSSDSRICHAGETILIAACSDELHIVNISPSAKLIKCNL